MEWCWFLVKKIIVVLINTYKFKSEKMVNIHSAIISGGTLLYSKSSQDNSKNACHRSLKSCAEMITARVHLNSPVFYRFRM